MKLSGILLPTLFFGMGLVIFAVKSLPTGNTANVPTPRLKSELKTGPVSRPKADTLQLPLKLSMPVIAGSHGRLSVDGFSEKNTPTSEVRNTDSESTNLLSSLAQEESPIRNPIKEPLSLQLSALNIETAAPVSLPYRSKIEPKLFADHIVDIAQTSPVQPDARNCGTLNATLKSAPKHAKVRSLGMQRQLTNRTSIGVEYVYKDGCYKNAIAPLKSFDMPGDDGVNLRVNMRF